MRAGWWGFWERPSVVDRAAGTNTTLDKWGLGDGVLMDRTEAFDWAAGTSTTPAECVLGGGVLREKPGIIFSHSWCLQQGVGHNGYCWTPSDYFIHQESSLPPKCLHQSLDPTGYWWPSSTNSLYLRSCVFIMARMMLAIVGLPVTITSIKNHILLLQGIWKRARMMLSIACISCLFHSPGIISFLPMALRSCWLSLASLWLFHPSGLIFFSCSMFSAGLLVFCMLLASFWLFHPTGIVSVYSMTP